MTPQTISKAGRAMWFIANRDVIKQNASMIDEWQVVVSSANAGGQKRDNQLEIVDNHSAYGRARVGLRSFKTFREAEIFYNYVRTYLVRYAFLMTDEALTTLGKRVPDLADYSGESGILDFNNNLDEQLFEFSEMTAEEEIYIRGVVDNIRKKEMT